jgi:ssDNA thymidine ADP-ribosyltransferase, DarT
MSASPSQAAARRGVSELLHYTTQKGIHGTIASSALLSRAQLEQEEYLALIREPVWPRRDAPWIDHISLSVTTINDDLFWRSRSHFPLLWWAVVTVSPTVLDDAGVVFTTTNNIYPSVRRGEGVDGFEAMFADEVVGRYGVVHTRAGLPDAQPTDRAAEVLYPQRIETGRIQAIYVMEPDHKHMILGWCAALDHQDIPVEVRPDAFG